MPVLVKGAIVHGLQLPGRLKPRWQTEVDDPRHVPHTGQTSGAGLEHSGACLPICLPINRFDPGQPGRWCRESASAAATMPPTSMSLIREELAQLTEATSKVEIQGGRYLSP